MAKYERTLHAMQQGIEVPAIVKNALLRETSLPYYFLGKLFAEKQKHAL